MSNLKSLFLVALTKPRNDPVMIRRENLRARLEEQKRLLQDNDYVRSVQRWAKVDGQKTLTTKQLRVHPWWWTDASGHVFMSVKVRNQLVEFDKGRAAIAVPSLDELPSVIDTLIKAVGAGELDQFLSPANPKQAQSKVRRSA